MPNQKSRKNAMHQTIIGNKKITCSEYTYLYHIEMRHRYVGS